MEIDVVALTRTLIDIPSVSGEEGIFARRLGALLEELGWRVELTTALPGRPNVFARLENPARIVFSSHLDTVPPFIPSRIDRTNIYGRGACDAKGIIAAQIVAAERLREIGVRDIGLLFVVDEEASSRGARAANSIPASRDCEFLINGEPTDNVLVSGTKGSLRVLLHSRGTSVHSAYPEYGESAIVKLIDVLVDIRSAEWPSDPLFGETTLNIGTIAGGIRSNVVPSNAESELHFRIATDCRDVRDRLDGIVAGRVGILEVSATEPFVLEVPPGFPSRIAAFTSDVPHLSNWGRPVLVGPGSILDAHTTGERIAIAELRRAVDVYTDLACALLTSGVTASAVEALQ